MVFLFTFLYIHYELPCEDCNRLHHRRSHSVHPCSLRSSPHHHLWWDLLSLLYLRLPRSHWLMFIPRGRGVYFIVFFARFSCSLFSPPRSSLALVWLSLLVALFSLRLPRGLSLCFAFLRIAWLCLCFPSSSRSGGCGFPLGVARCSLFEGSALLPRCRGVYFTVFFTSLNHDLPSTVR